LGLGGDAEQGIRGHRVAGLHVDPADGMLVGDSAVAQHQADGAADLPGIDVLLHEAVDACDAIRGERDDLGGKRSWSNEDQDQRKQTRAIHSTLQYYGGGAFPITASRSWGARSRHSFLKSAVSATSNLPT